MKKIILATFLLITFISNAQSFQWGFPFEITDETEATLEHYYLDNSLHRLYSKYDLGVFNYNIIVDHFSGNDLEKNNTSDLSIKQPAMGLNMQTHLTHFQENDADFSFFSYEFDRSTKENNLYSQQVNILSGTKSDPIKITSILGKNISRAGNYEIAQSNNKKYYVVLKELPYAKKMNEKVSLVLLDSNKNVIKEIEHTFSFLDKRNKKQSIYVSNNGQVYLIKNIKLKKQKAFKNIYIWNTNSNEVKEVSLKLDDNYQIHQFDIDFDTDNNFYFNGLFTHEGATSIGLKIDLSGRYSGVRSSGIISLKISDDDEVLYKQRNDFGQIISNLSIKDFVFNNGTFWFLMDKMHVVKKSNSTNLTQGNITYDYSYLSNGMFYGTLNSENGQINWTKNIDTNERNTKNDNGDFLSYLYFFKDNELVLLYNETHDLNKGFIHTPFLRRFPVKEVYTTEGVQVSKEDILAAGIGVKKDEEFELNTSISLKINDNTYIIRARSNAEYKYGYLKFQ